MQPSTIMCGKQRMTDKDRERDEKCERYRETEWKKNERDRERE